MSDSISQRADAQSRHETSELTELTELTDPALQRAIADFVSHERAPLYVLLIAADHERFAVVEPVLSLAFSAERVASMIVHRTTQLPPDASLMAKLDLVLIVETTDETAFAEPRLGNWLARRARVVRATLAGRDGGLDWSSVVWPSAGVPTKRARLIYRRGNSTASLLLTEARAGRSGGLSIEPSVMLGNE
ncbi:MAG: hypothetical protein U0165_04545 [Polyangiaceae bacterium]